MKKKLRRMYLFLASGDYGEIEREITTYVSPFNFGRDLKANQVSYLEWDVYGFQLSRKGEESTWDAYHTYKCAQYFPNRLILIIDKFTLGFFDDVPSNMLLMDQPNWPNLMEQFYVQTNSNSKTDNGQEAD